VAEVEALASGLVRAGVEPDDVVMVQLPNVVELVALYFAAARIGAIVSPLPIQYRGHALRATMELVAPTAFVTTTRALGFDHLARGESLRAEVPSLRRVVALGDAPPAGVLPFAALAATPVDRAALDARSVSADDVHTICWTSGTEAEPKGVPRSHNQWLAIGRFTTDGYPLEPGATLLNPFPIVSMAGIGGMMVPWLQCGGTMVLHQPLSL